MGMVTKSMSLTTMIIMLSIENISLPFLSYFFAVDLKFIVSISHILLNATITNKDREFF